MACCSSNFVPYLPTPWRNLEQLDREILDEFSNDHKCLTYFLEFLERKDSPGACFTEFVQAHPTLCKSAIALLTPEERSHFSTLTEKVEQLAAGREGADIFFSGYDWLGLPERWRGPEPQEQDMIQFLENNRADLEHFVDGLSTTSEWNIWSYKRVALSAVAMLYMDKSDDPAFINTLHKVQRCMSTLSGHEYNAILVKYGCTEGLGAFTGWLCENDPTAEVQNIIPKMGEIRAIIAQQQARGEKVDTLLETQLAYCRATLKDLARPWRVSPERNFGS